MEFNYTVTKEDLAEAIIFRDTNIPKDPRTKRLLVLSGFAIVFVFIINILRFPAKWPSSLAEFTNNIGDYIHYIFMFLVAITGMLFLLSGKLRRNASVAAARSQMEEFSKTWLLGEQKMKIEEDGLSVTSYNERKYPWRTVEKAAETKTHIFIFMKGSTEDMAIPKKFLSGGEASEILGALSSRNIKVVREHSR